MQAKYKHGLGRRQDLGAHEDSQAPELGQLLQELHAPLRDPRAPNEAELLQVGEGRQLFDASIGEGVAVDECELLEASHGCDVCYSLRKTHSFSIYPGAVKKVGYLLRAGASQVS